MKESQLLLENLLEPLRITSTSMRFQYQKICALINETIQLLNTIAHISEQQNEAYWCKVKNIYWLWCKQYWSKTKFKVGYHVRISKFKKRVQNVKHQIDQKKFLLLRKLK